MSVVNMNIQDVKNAYLNKEVHVIYNENGVEIDTRGIVTSVDSHGRLQGTWGPYLIIPGKDYIGVND
mgnify:CR=1 FL=1